MDNQRIPAGRSRDLLQIDYWKWNFPMTQSACWWLVGVWSVVGKSSNLPTSCFQYQGWTQRGGALSLSVTTNIHVNTRKGIMNNPRLPDIILHYYCIIKATFMFHFKSFKERCTNRLADKGGGGGWMDKQTITVLFIPLIIGSVTTLWPRLSIQIHTS